MAPRPETPRFAPAAVTAAGNARGILFMAAGMALFSVVDAGAKFLTGGLHPIQIVWSRQLGLVLGVLVLLALNGTSVLRTPRPGLQVLRGVMAAGSATAFIAAIAHVALADAVAISFVAPFMVTMMAALILRERVGLRRWGAVIVGFLGALVVIRPGLGVVHPAALLVVLAAGLFAGRQIISRALSATDRTATTVAYTALVSATVLTLPLPFVWQTPSGLREIALLAGIAALAALAEIMVIKALQIAEAVVVAPLQYTLLIWGTGWGWLIFGQLPDGWTLAGALIIVASGAYTIARERRLARRAAR